MKPSDDWKIRCANEYSELCGRIERLENMLHDYSAGTLDYTPNCPHYLLQAQLDAMREYREVLEARNYIEHMWGDWDE